MPWHHNLSITRVDFVGAFFISVYDPARVAGRHRELRDETSRKLSDHPDMVQFLAAVDQA